MLLERSHLTRCDLLEYFIARPKGSHRAINQQQELINKSDCKGAMRDNHHRNTARFQSPNRLRKGGVPFGVKIGVGLIQDDKRRFAVKRARKR